MYDSFVKMSFLLSSGRVRMSRDKRRLPGGEIGMRSSYLDALFGVSLDLLPYCRENPRPN